jgi:hypothetical protein
MLTPCTKRYGKIKGENKKDVVLGIMALIQIRTLLSYIFPETLA